MHPAPMSFAPGSTSELPPPRHVCICSTINTMTFGADAIADCVLATFDQLPDKRKPRPRNDGSREWVPLAGIVLSKGNLFCCIRHALWLTLIAPVKTTSSPASLWGKLGFLLTCLLHNLHVAIRPYWTWACKWTSTNLAATY
jgi:hypothetical protein